MKTFLPLILGLCLAFLLTGCIGEDYDFTPPAVILSNPYDTQSEELEETNMDWQSDKHYQKETEDILSFAREQKQLYFNSGQQVDLLFDSEDFAVNELSVSVWQNDKKIDLELKDDRSFYFPKEKGEYVIVVDLLADSGNAQYVGNIVIK